MGARPRNKCAGSWVPAAAARSTTDDGSSRPSTSIACLARSIWCSPTSEARSETDDYDLQIRLGIGTFVVCASLLVGVVACDDTERVTCVVKLGTAQTSVPLDTKVGASSVATVGSYTVAFSILDGRKLKAEVRDTKSTLMTVTAGALSQEESGSTPTPDGQLQFSCAP